MNSKLRQISLILSVCLVLGSMLAVWFAVDGRDVPDSVRESRTCSPVTHASQGGEGDAVPPMVVTHPTGAESKQEPSPVLADQVSSDPWDHRITWRFVTSNGEPVPNVSFDWWVTMIPPGVQRVGQTDTHSAEPHDGIKGRQSSIGDNLGEAHVSVTVARCSQFLLAAEIVSSQWTMMRHHDDSGPNNLRLYPIRWGSEYSLVVVVLQAFDRLPLSVVYGDSQPFHGLTRLTFYGSSATPISSTKLAIQGQEVNLDVPQSATSVRVTAWSQRMGWGPTHTQRVELGRTRALRVVIGQAKRPMCGVRVDLSDCPGGDGWTFMHVGEGHLTWGEEYVCYTLPTGQPHIIRIESPNGVWETGVFTLTRGEIHRFKPEFLRPGLVRLRVVDDTGRPLSPSLVSTRQGSPNWTSQKARSPALARTSGVLAYGDQNGEILLDGIATNRPITLHVEAKGYEFITRVVEIRPEETLDIGDVVLHPATGSVRVEFKHVSDAKHEFIVLLNQVGGSTLNRKTTTGDEVLFSNLSLKRAHYHVLVAPGKGVPGKVYSVSLDRDQPHKDVIVDIRDLASARLRETTAETEAPE